MKTLKDLKATILQNPEFKAEYDTLALAPQNLYQITGNVADVNTVLIERAELHRLQAENSGLLALASGGIDLFERYSTFKAKCADLEAQLYTIGAGGVGQSIRPAVQADTSQEPGTGIPASVPTGWKLVPVEPTDDMFIEGMEADCLGRPSIDDDNHVRSICRAMLSSAPDAPPPPAAQQRPVAWIDVKPNPFDPSCRGSASVQDHALPPGEHKLYAAPNPARQPLTVETFTKLAHRMATKYTHRSDPSFAWYAFLPHTLEQFVRAIEAAHDITRGQK